MTAGHPSDVPLNDSIGEYFLEICPACLGDSDPMDDLFRCSECLGCGEIKVYLPVYEDDDGTDSARD